MEKQTECNNQSVYLGRLWCTWWKYLRKKMCIFISPDRIIVFIQNLFKLCTFSAKPGAQQPTRIHCDLNTYERCSREYLWPAEMNGLLHTLTVQSFSQWDDGSQCLSLTSVLTDPYIATTKHKNGEHTSIIWLFVSTRQSVNKRIHLNL